MAPPSTARVLIIGDRFGVLTCALDRFGPWVLSDSIVSETTIANNRATNGLTGSARMLSTSDVLGSIRSTDSIGPVDLVVWNVERSNALLAYHASLLAPISHADTIVAAAGMDKHLPPTTADVLRRIGDVTTHPGARKAHLFEVRPQPGIPGFLPLQSTRANPVVVPELDLVLTNGPGVFSADRLDLGTRLLAMHAATPGTIPRDAQVIVDLGCGGGVLGIVALRANRDAHVHFLDESAHAIESARANVEANVPGGLSRSTFTRSDVFAHASKASTADVRADLVLCNPPFHTANTTGDEVAWRMMKESRAQLNPPGELWLVGNRHLGYHAKMSRLFGNVRRLGTHPKFVLLASRR